MEGQGVDELYRSCSIHTAIRLNLDTDCWIPEADVSWDEEGKHLHTLLSGPKDRFKIIDHAEIYAVEMARTWIDAELIVDLTP